MVFVFLFLTYFSLYDWLCCCCCWVTSVVSDSVRPHMAAHQAPPSLGFSRQEHWSGLPFPSPWLTLGPSINTVFQLTQFCSFLWPSNPGGPAVENLPASAWDARDADLIPRLGRSPGVGNGNLLQCSCLENPMNKGAWWAIVHGVAKSRTWLSD